MDKCALCGHDKDEHYSPIGCHHKENEELCTCVWGSILDQRWRVTPDQVQRFRAGFDFGYPEGKIIITSLTS